jgi:hypothetical protein
VNSAEYLFEAEVVFHRQHKFGQQVAGMLANNSYTENAITAWRTEHLDKPECPFIRNSAVQVFQAVARDLEFNAALVCFRLGQADPGNLWMGERSPWNYRVIHLETLEAAKQCIDRRIPRLVGGDMRKLIWPGYISTRIDVGIERLQPLIRFNRPL